MVYERVLLQTIKFDLQVEHPYSILLKIGKLLKGTVYYELFSTSFYIIPMLPFLVYFRVSPPTTWIDLYR